MEERERKEEHTRSAAPRDSEAFIFLRPPLYHRRRRTVYHAVMETIAKIPSPKPLCNARDEGRRCARRVVIKAGNGLPRSAPSSRGGLSPQDEHGIGDR